MGIVLYYLLSMLAGFAVQFLLCKKIKNKTGKYIPTYLVFAGWVLILLLSLGIFGNMGDSFYGFSFAALVFAVFFLPPTIGILSADIFYMVQTRKNAKRNDH